MPQSGGPFSQYLTEPVRSQVPQPTGFEGNAATIAHIGSKFLEGLRQSRLQKAAMAEQQNEKTQRGYEQAIHFLDQNKDLDPQIKQQYLNKISQAYLGHIAGVPESSKDTGHPMTDMLKNVALNLSGGQMPQKKAPLDMSLIGEAMTVANDPVNNIHNKWARLNSDYATAVKTGKIGDIKTASAHPMYPMMRSESQRMFGEARDPDIFRSLAADPMKAMQESTILPIIKQRLEGRVTPGPTAQPQAIPGTDTQASYLRTTPPPTSAPTAFKETFTQSYNRRQSESLNDEYLAKNGFPLPPGGDPLPKLGAPQNYIDDDTGKEFLGTVLPNKFEGHEPGVYNKDQLVKNARRSALANPNTPKPLTPEQSAQKSIDLKTKLGEVVKSPHLKALGMASIDSNLQSGDVKGAGDVLMRVAQMEQVEAATAAARATAAAHRSEGNLNRQSAMALELSKHFLSSDPAKKMQVAEEFANGAQSAYNRIKAGGDPGVESFQILRTWAKMTDMMTGVRDSEYANLKDAMGALRKAGVFIDNLLDSTGNQIDPKMLDQTMTAINELRNNAHRQFAATSAIYKKQMDVLGVKGESPLLQNPYPESEKKALATRPQANNSGGSVVKLVPGAPGRRSGRSAAPPPAAAKQGIALAPL